MKQSYGVQNFSYRAKFWYKFHLWGKVMVYKFYLWNKNYGALTHLKETIKKSIYCRILQLNRLLVLKLNKDQ